MSGWPGPGEAQAPGRVAPRSRRPRPPHGQRACGARHTPSAGPAAGRPRRGRGDPAAPQGGRPGRAGCRGPGPRWALGRLPNLSRRSGGGASQTARGPILSEKFGWGGGRGSPAGLPPPTPPALGSHGRSSARLGAWAPGLLVGRCGQPANQWDGREEDGQDRGPLGLTWQPGQPGRWSGRGEVTPLPTLPLRGLAFKLGWRVRPDTRVLWASPQLWGPGSRPPREGV